MGASICWAAAEADTQFIIFDLSALKKQCFIFKEYETHTFQGLTASGYGVDRQKTEMRHIKSLSKNLKSKLWETRLKFMID